MLGVGTRAWAKLTYGTRKFAYKRDRNNTKHERKQKDLETRPLVTSCTLLLGNYNMHAWKQLCSSQFADRAYHYCARLWPCRWFLINDAASKYITFLFRALFSALRGDSHGVVLQRARLRVQMRDIKCWILQYSNLWSYMFRHGNLWT